MDTGFTDEQKMLGETVYKWACKWLDPQMEELDEKDEFPKDLFKETASLGINGITISEEYGGADLGYTEFCIAAENFGRISSALAMTWAAHCVLCMDNIHRNGTSEQKAKYLPPLLSGERIGCLAMTEPNAGSAVMSMTTRAMKDGDGYVVNGSKTLEAEEGGARRYPDYMKDRRNYKIPYTSRSWGHDYIVGKITSGKQTATDKVNLLKRKGGEGI